MNTVLECKNLSYHERVKPWMQKIGRTRQLIDVSFKLNPGETLGVIGESGSGKTTLAYHLVGILQATGGKLLLEETDVTKPNEQQTAELQRLVRMVFQNPATSLNPRLTIRKLLNNTLKYNTSMSHEDRLELIESSLTKVGLRSAGADQYPEIFSSGQLQRVALARALIVNPKVIVADEPLSTLDLTVRAQVINLLLELQQELELSYVFISHDLAVIKHISDRVIVLYEGVMVENGPVHDVLRHPLHPYTHLLLQLNPGISSAKANEDEQMLFLSTRKVNHKGCPFAYRCSFATDVCFDTMPEQQRLLDQVVRCHHPRT